MGKRVRGGGIKERVRIEKKDNGQRSKRKCEEERNQGVDG